MDLLRDFPPPLSTDEGDATQFTDAGAFAEAEGPAEAGAAEAAAPTPGFFGEEMFLWSIDGIPLQRKAYLWTDGDHAAVVACRAIFRCAEPFVPSPDNTPGETETALARASQLAKWFQKCKGDTTYPKGLFVTATRCHCAQRRDCSVCGRPALFESRGSRGAPRERPALTSCSCGVAGPLLEQNRKRGQGVKGASEHKKRKRGGTDSDDDQEEEEEEGGEELRKQLIALNLDPNDPRLEDLYHPNGTVQSSFAAIIRCLPDLDAELQRVVAEHQRDSWDAWRVFNGVLKLDEGATQWHGMDVSYLLELMEQE